MPNISWEGPIFANSSLSLVNREILNILKKDHSLVVYPTDNNLHTNNQAVTKLFPLMHSYLPATKIDIAISHKFPPNLETKRGKYWIIILPWELGSLPKKWLPALCENINEIWVYSNHIKKVCIEGTIPADKVKVINLGINPDIFNPTTKPLHLPTKKKFKFLFLGGAIYRKGIDIILDTYTKTFTKDDSVSLIIKDFKSNEFYTDPQIADQIKNCINNQNYPEIIHLTHDIAAEQMGGLYNACDCLVSPYRAEGFCLPILEAMACSLPTIAPNYGACLDFTSNSTNRLLKTAEVYLKTKTIENLELTDFPYWGEVNKEDLSRAMKDIFINPQKASQLTKRALLKANKHFTWHHTAQNISDRIKQITNNCL